MQGMPESDVHALERLLSPSGALFKALLSADADGLINFIFPLERLPIRTQLLLRSAPGRWLSGCACGVHAKCDAHMDIC